jgi:hypothetical protein
MAFAADISGALEKRLMAVQAFVGRVVTSM